MSLGRTCMFVVEPSKTISLNIDDANSSFIVVALNGSAKFLNLPNQSTKDAATT